MKPTAPAIALFVAALLALMAVLALPRLAPSRVLTITAPASVQPHRNIFVQVTALTRVGDGEEVGFLQVEFSRDGGEHWAGVAYDADLGPRGVNLFPLDVGDADTTTLVRARAAFRHGAAGDVDFHGEPLDWNGTWENWAEPPAVMATIKVR